MEKNRQAALINLSGREDIPSLANLVQAAQGKQAADLLLKNCRMVNVHSGEILRTDIRILGGRIASITAGGEDNAREVIDCTDYYAIPGMIDPHMHVDTTLLMPGELSRVLVPRGTTTVFVDTVNLAHSGGKAAIQSLIEAFQGLPLRAFISAPSYTPLEPGLETAAVEITSADIAEMLEWPGVVSIGETVSSKILNCEPDFLKRLLLCHALGKTISGHGGDLPRGDERSLDAYAAAGVSDDHCVNRPGDILPRLRRGMTMFLVEAPGREQIRGLFEHILAQRIPTHKMCLCIDNITVMDIVAAGGGYLEKPFQIGLDCGLPPVDVVRMATLNPAVHYGMEGQIGSLTPGRLADVVLLGELDRFPPEIVIAGGKVAARQGEMVAPIPPPPVSAAAYNTIHLPADLSPARLEVKARDGRATAMVRTIRVVDGDAVNQCFVAELSCERGIVQPDLKNDILKMAIIERYGHNGNLTNAFVHGFSLQGGAMATSYSIPSNNIVVVGVEASEMLCAVRHLAKIQGGLVVVRNGAVLAEVRLPFYGIMSDKPFEMVLSAVEQAVEAARSLGCRLQHPFFTMAQTVLSSLPDVGLTDRGLVDVRSGKIISVIMEE